MPAFGTVRVAAIQATPVILDAEATVEKAAGLLAEAAGRGARLAVLPEAFVSLYPSNAWARSATGVRRLGRAVGADVGLERRRLAARSSPASSRPAASTASTASSGSTSARTSGPGRSTTRCSRSGPEGLRAPAPQAHADDAGARLPRLRRGRRPRGARPRGRRPRRRAHLLGEPDAAGALRRLPAGPADLGRPDRRRQRRLAREHAPHRDRVRRVRRLGAAVHPGLGVPGRLPGPAAGGQGGLRRRRRGDRRADMGRT